MNKNKIVLCVEDSEQIQTFNKLHLEAKGFKVRLAMTLAGARDEINRETPDLIILDIHLPDGNGLDFLRELRRISNIPVIALTDSKEDIDIVKGFASGCDDYVPKPYAFPVLYARIEGLMRRVSSVPEIIEKGPLRLDVLAGLAFINGADLLLAQKEFSLLLLFVQNEDKTMSAEYLYEKIWKTMLNDNTNALKNAISRLRNKIFDSGYNIFAVRGEGYVFKRE